MIKVLLIENDQKMRENTAAILQLANYHVMLAEDGKEGYEKALKELPDIIIGEINTPGLDGYGLLYLLNKNDQLKHVPFIFLTAKTERKYFRKGMEMGADDFITKPFTELELLNAIESILQKKKYLEERAITNRLSNPSFRGINNQEALELLTQSGEVRSYNKRQRIYTEGRYPQCLYYLYSGKARAFRTNESGKELTTTLYKPGDFIGYKSLLGETANQESTETLEDCEIGIIKKEDFENLMYSHKSVAQQFVKILANNITEKEDQLIGLAYNSLRKRVADVILRLLEKYQLQEKENFTLHISREDLAQMVGTATESLIRTLSDFKNEKLIETKAGSIKVLDEKKLKQLVN